MQPDWWASHGIMANDQEDFLQIEELKGCRLEGSEWFEPIEHARTVAVVESDWSDSKQCIHELPHQALVDLPCAHLFLRIVHQTVKRVFFDHLEDSSGQEDKGVGRCVTLWVGV